MYKYYKELEKPNDFKTILNSSSLGEEENLFEYVWPNSWYITPDGYLYNSGSKDGHKEGNLVYPFDRVCHAINKDTYTVFSEDIKNDKMILKRKEYTIPLIDNNERIEKILDRGYITYDELIFYTNKIGYFKEGVDLLRDLSEATSDDENLIKIVIGHMAAENAFYSAFNDLNKTINPINSLQTIKLLTSNDLDDILVRFCGFNKISYQNYKTISISDIEQIELFREYLKNGWNLELVPKIYYDNYERKIKSVNLDSGFINKYLDEKIGEYKGKGKIIIRSDTYFGNRK